jgi:acylphosphatase
MRSRPGRETVSDVARARLRVYGVVQGVGYRYFVRKAATELGLQGVVRNRSDGSVEVVAEGERSAINALIDQLKVGPRYASVERIDPAWEEPAGDLDGFRYAF